MDLHHEPVVEAHARHLGQHLRAEEFGILRRHALVEHAPEQFLGFARREVGGARAGMAVVGRRRAHAPEEVPAASVSREIAVPRLGVLARERGQFADAVAEAGELGVHDRVGPVRGEHTALPAAPQQRVVVRQLVERRLGRRQHLDVEALEEGPGPELGPLQAGADVFVVVVRGLHRQAVLEAEDIGEHLVEPHRGRRTAEQVDSGGRTDARPPSDRYRCPVRRRPVCRAIPSARPGCRACGRDSDPERAAGSWRPATPSWWRTRPGRCGRADSGWAGRVRWQRSGERCPAARGRPGRAGPRAMSVAAPLDESPCLALRIFGPRRLS